MKRPTVEDRQRVSDAVRAAEGNTSGEIVTIVADRSDGYEDIGLVYAGLAALFVPVLFAAWPALPLGILARFTSGWGATEVRDLMLLTFVAMALVSAVQFGALQYQPLRMYWTPRAVRRTRVRTRAIELFKVGAEARTTGRTGILIYLSLGEHMAEIVADEAIHAKVPENEWGDAMIAMVAEVREGRIADGMIAAVNGVGKILSTHLPRAADDTNELPDRLIEL
ncbi:MAG: TPM domain-containing protein [Sphingomonas sp.]